MDRSLRILAWLLAVLLILGAVIWLTLPSLAERFKPELTAAIRDATGWNLEIKGPLGLSLYPFLGVAIEDLELAESNGATLAQIQSLRAGLGLLPLLGGKIAIHQVLLEKPVLHLRRDASGRLNWKPNGADLSAATKPTDSGTPAPPRDPPDSPPRQLPSLAVKTIRVAQGEVHLEDAEREESLTLQEIELSLRDFSLQPSVEASSEAAELDLNFRLEDRKRQLALSSQLSLEFILGSDLKSLRVNEGEWKLMSADHSEQALNLRFFGQLQQVAATPSAEVQIDLAPFAPKRWLQTFSVPLPAMQGDVPLGSAALSARLKLQGSQIEVPHFSVTLDDTQVEGELSVQDDMQNVEIDLKGNRINLDDYLPAPRSEANSPPAAEPLPPPSSAPAAMARAKSSPLVPILPSELKVKARVRFENIQAAALTLAPFEADFQLSEGQGRIELPGTQLEGQPVKLLTIASGLSEGDRVQLSLEAAGPLPLSAEQSPDGKARTLQIAMDTDLLTDRHLQNLEIRSAVLNLENLTLRSNGSVRNLRQPTLDLHLVAPPFDARQLAASLGIEIPEMQGSETLKALGLNTRIQGQPQDLVFAPLALRIDQTRIKGEARFAASGSARGGPQIRARLSGDQVMLDPYLPPEAPPSDTSLLPLPTAASAEPTMAAGDDPSPTREARFPKEKLRQLELDVQFGLDRLTVREYAMQNLDVSVRAQQGLIELQRANAALYNGTLSSSGRLDVRGDTALVRFSNDISGVNASRFPPSLSRQTFLNGWLVLRPQGRINATTRYESKGDAVSEILENTQASLDLFIEKGALEEFSTLSELYQLAARFGSEVKDSSKLLAATPFRDLNTRFRLDGTRLNHERYTLQLNQDADVQGSGQIDLVSRRLDYRFRLVPTPTFARRQGRWAKALTAAPLQYRCQGGLTTADRQLDCQLDEGSIKAALEKSLKEKARRSLEEKAQKLLDEKAGDALKDVGKDLLKDLFKR